MSKLRMLIGLLYATLWTMGVYAQQPLKLSLEELFELADKNSKTIITQTAALNQAQQAVKEARSARLPDIDLSLSASYLGNGHLTDRDFTNGMNIDMPHLSNNFAIEAVQLIYGGGAVSTGIALAKLQEEMATISLEESRSRVRFMLTGFFLDLCKMRNLHKVYQSNITLTKQLITDTRSRNAAGVALVNDITRFELQLKQLEFACKRVENSIEILNYDLVTMLALPAETIIEPTDELLEQTLPLGDEAYWQQQSTTNAHSLKQTALAVEMSEKQLTLARAERLPKVVAVAANHFDGPITIEVPVIDKNFNYWYVGLGVSFRLSSLYKSGKTIKLAKLNTEFNRRKYDEVAEQMNMAIKSDYIKYLEAYDEVATMQKNVELAHQNYSTIDTRYRNDIALTTDMIDATSQRLDAELQLVNARINTIFCYYKLLHTSGTL